MDINSAVGREAGISDEQLADIAIFETSQHFDHREKVVLRYAEGMTRTPAEVSDAVFEDLKTLFTTAQIVELTAAVALENFRARFNCALKIESDNLCMLPPDHPVRQAVKK
ncbi:MAG: carboxymuconolactone decarboxylase family protein [Deltaproteobacteria bacterium]|nr:carboxymuconolactone decarboxylase family protein [Deltaproteobacteria bacterium]